MGILEGDYMMIDTRSEAMVRKGLPSHKALTKQNKHLTRLTERLSKKTSTLTKKVERLEARLVKRQATYDRKIKSLNETIAKDTSHTLNLYDDISDLQKRLNRKGDNRQYLLDLASVPQLPPEGVNLQDLVSCIRSEMIDQALHMSNGHQTQAGKLLGITPQSIHAYCKQLKEAA